ncbi:hypothetical protein Nepgr_021096 [Nepenthes gracilis]|uniref:Uncharacterized protein n=1 Tax=Nepenthes gracilis TaxID=150966 RepID=A0AAD3SY26_NEPGR|nr:hypothetical protein Nepgr_021096 [Nepenthes gracilis]
MEPGNKPSQGESEKLPPRTLRVPLAQKPLISYLKACLAWVAGWFFRQIAIKCRFGVEAGWIYLLSRLHLPDHLLFCSVWSLGQFLCFLLQTLFVGTCLCYCWFDCSAWFVPYAIRISCCILRIQHLPVMGIMPDQLDAGVDADADAHFAT